MSAMEETHFLSTQEALKRLGVTAPTFKKWVDELHIPRYQGTGRAIKYRQEDIERIYNEKVRIRPKE